MDIIDLIDKLLLLSDGITKPRVYSYIGPDCANGLAVMGEGDPDMRVVGVVNLDTGEARRHAEMSFLDVMHHYDEWSQERKGAVKCN